MKHLFGIIIALAFVIFSATQMISLKETPTSSSFIIYAITAVFFTGVLVYALLKKKRN
jgi:drug/metabolite transporter (DMT)-like permease